MTTKTVRIKIVEQVIDAALIDDTGAFGGTGNNVGGGGGGGGGGSGTSWASWAENMTIAQWNAATGLTALQYINAQDSASVTLGIPDVVDKINDKSGNARNLDFDNTATLVNLLTTNGVNCNGAYGSNTAVCSTITGNAWSNPLVIDYCFQIPRYPTGTETLISLGGTAVNAFRTLDITSSGLLQYTYRDDSGNTLTKTGAVALPFDTKILVRLAIERSKVRVIVHDGNTLDHSTQITDEGAFNVTSTLDQLWVNCKFANGAASQQRTSGYYFGHIIAEGIQLSTFASLDASCQVFNVPFANTDISTLATGLISLIQGPGAGGLTTPKADVVDLITGMVFTATGTQPAAIAGKFHNALGLSMTASTVYLQGVVPPIWDIYSGTYGDYTIYVRHKTGTIDASTRNIFCLNPTTSPSTNNIRLQQSTTNTWQLQVDNVAKATSTITAVSDTWYDFVIKGSAGVHTFSVNGETPITFTPGTRSSVGGYFGLGAHFTAVNTLLHPGRGALDCLALWNRALTSAEIVQLRNNGNGRDGFFNYLASQEYAGGGGGTPVTEYRGTQLGANTRSNAYCTGSVATGSGATYLSFTSPRSGRLRAVSVYWKSDTPNGYSAGTGGTYTLSVRTDNAGVPSATVVSEVTGVTGWALNPANTSTDYKTSTFTTAGMITAGTKYHLCIINTSSSPLSNWVCINTSDIFSGGTTAKIRPTMSANHEWGFRLGTGKTGALFNDYTTYKGAACITFHVDKDDNGTSDFWFGHPNAGQESGNSRALSTPFGGARWIRQILPIESGDNFTIQSVFVALTRLGLPGDLTATIRSSNGTTILGTATIAQANYTQESSIKTTTQFGWGEGVFSSPISITGGNTYYLVLSSPAGTFDPDVSVAYYPVVFQDAQASNYSSPAGISGVKGGWYGNTGYLQTSINSGGTWSNYSGTAFSGTKGDLGFYLRVTIP